MTTWIYMIIETNIIVLINKRTLNSCIYVIVYVWMIHCVCQHNEIIQLVEGPGWFSQYSISLRSGPLRVRTPVGPRDFLFPTPAQHGFGTHLASCTMGTWALSGVKHLGCGIDHPLPLCLHGMWWGKLYLHFYTFIVSKWKLFELNCWM